MGNALIHSTALIEGEDISLGENVSIGAFSIIESGVSLGDNVEIAAHAIIRSGSDIAKDCRIDSFAVIGGDPQFSGFDRGISSGVRIGENTIVREGVTIHRSCYENQFTEIGKHCMFMGNAHVAHDCKISDSVILANGVLLAGHVSVGKKTFVGGAAAVHQFVRIGQGAMVGGLAAISKDVPPYCMITDRNIVHGLNLVGLKRSGVERESIKLLKDGFRHVFSSTNARKLAAEYKHSASEHDRLTTELEEFLTFFEDGDRGFSVFQPEKRS